MKQIRVPRHIRQQTQIKELEAAHTRPAAGSMAAPEELPPARTRIAAARYGGRIVEVAAGQNLVLAPANPNRRYFFVVNQGAFAARVDVGQPASAATGMNLAASGGFWEPLVPPANSVEVFSASGTTLYVLEG